MDLTKTKVANLALSQLSVGLELSNVDTDAGKEARACRAYWDVALGKVLRDFVWPQFNGLEILPRLAINTDPRFAYAYRSPSASKYFRGIVGQTSGNSIPPDLYRRNYLEYSFTIPFAVSTDEEGAVILTDAESPIGSFTKVLPVAFWPDDFSLAFADLLAFYIAPSITGGDQFKLGDKAYQRYQVQIKDAFRNQMNEQDQGPARMSGFEACR